MKETACSCMTVAALFCILAGAAVVGADHQVYLPFFDDMETPNYNWEPGGDWARVNYDSHRGRCSITDSPWGDYRHGTDYAVTTSFYFSLAETQNPKLEFWDRYEFGKYDHGWVDISTNMGDTWIPIWDHYRFKNEGWRRRTVDLREYRGKTRVKLRFRVEATSDSDIGDGWFIDDVLIWDKPVVVFDVPIYDDMENCGKPWEAAGEWATIHCDFASDSTCWADSPHADYVHTTNYALTSSFNVNLHYLWNPKLEFMEKYYIGCTDHAYVEISTNFGSTWEILLDHYQFTDCTWGPRTVDLQSYICNPNVKFRFRLDAEEQSAVHDGWYIDDVMILDRPIVTVAPPFEDDMEGRRKWEPGGYWAASHDDFCSDSTAWTDSPRDDYVHGYETCLTMMENVDLSNAVDPVMNFWNHYDLGGGDYAYVDVSTDFGETWEPAFNHYNSTQLGWVMHSVDLRPYIGAKDVKVRFRLDARDNGSTGDGWFVDDVEIKDKASDPPLVVDIIPPVDVHFRPGEESRFRVVVTNRVELFLRCNVWFELFSRRLGKINTFGPIEMEIPKKSSEKQLVRFSVPGDAREDYYTLKAFVGREGRPAVHHARFYLEVIEEDK